MEQEREKHLNAAFVRQSYGGQTSRPTLPWVTVVSNRLRQPPHGSASPVTTPRLPGVMATAPATMGGVFSLSRSPSRSCSVGPPRFPSAPISTCASCWTHDATFTSFVGAICTGNVTDALPMGNLNVVFAGAWVIADCAAASMWRSRPRSACRRNYLARPGVRARDCWHVHMGSRNEQHGVRLHRCRGRA